MKDKTKKSGIPSLRRLPAENIVPVLLSTAVTSAITYIYVHSSGTAVLFFTLAAFAFSALTFGIYEILRGINKTWFTTVVVIAYGNICLFAGMRQIDSFGSFTQWFMEPSTFTSLYVNRTAAILLVLGGMLITCLYYFTRVRYRGVFVFLICQCPFCLFAKTFTTIPNIYPIIIMTLFFFILTSHTGSGGSDADAYRTGARGRRMAVGTYVLIITVIASFMPKLEFAPFRENFDEFVTGVTISTAQAVADFSDFNDSSADSTSGDDTTIVFYFRGDNPGLLKRQSFNYYDSNDHLWKYDVDDSNTGYSNWKRYTLFEDPTALYEAAGYDGGEAASGSCMIAPASGNVKAVYVPQNLTDIDPYYNGIDVYRTYNDEYFISSEDSPKVRAYQTGWAVFTPEPGFMELFTDELAESLAEDSEAAASYIRAKEQAEKYYGSGYYNPHLSEPYSSEAAHLKVSELTESIIADCASDYEKACAIERFFLKGDYIYDINFTSYDASPDTFILNTKRGACAAYATAMTLMCREAGLTVRYCEGFWIQQRGSGADMWYVTTADSHSFVQVWLNGYGWTNFNPTSSVTDGGYVDPTFIIVGITAAVITLIGAIFIIMLPVIKEKLYRDKIFRARGAKQYSLIYNKINPMLNHYEKKRVNTYTPAETAQRCRELFGYDISGFIDSYENAVYGGISDDTDLSGVYRGFAAAYRQKIKQDRRDRKKRK